MRASTHRRLFPSKGLLLSRQSSCQANGVRTTATRFRFRCLGHWSIMPSISAFSRLKKVRSTSLGTVRTTHLPRLMRTGDQPTWVALFAIYSQDLWLCPEREVINLQICRSRAHYIWDQSRLSLQSQDVPSVLQSTVARLAKGWIGRVLNQLPRNETLCCHVVVAWDGHQRDRLAENVSGHSKPATSGRN